MANIITIIPKQQLEATQKQVTDIVKATDNNMLHDSFVRMRGFFEMFQTAVKDEFIKRTQKEGKIHTDVGDIQYIERANFTFNEDKISAFLKKKKIADERIYKLDFKIATKNPKVLSKLLDEGHIVETKKIDTKLYDELSKEYPELLKFVENNPTGYIKGL